MNDKDHLTINLNIHKIFTFIPNLSITAKKCLRCRPFSVVCLAVCPVDPCYTFHPRALRFWQSLYYIFYHNFLKDFFDNLKELKICPFPYKIKEL